MPSRQAFNPRDGLGDKAPALVSRAREKDPSFPGMSPRLPDSSFARDPYRLREVARVESVSTDDEELQRR
ncbi:MAG: hypothetical protein HYS35_05875 [Betaproteobacteria bacterium]|nr:hypothetical protein [Betaproteobacteria bacterium]